MRKLLSIITVVLAAAVVGGGWRGAEAHEHHVVGGDRGWEVSNDIASWSSDRNFAVGDFIWFAYSAAQESIVELGSREEYISCDLSNPIRMYTDGLDQIPLEGEGIRYFASGKLESCKNGLKLPVTVRSRESTTPPSLLAADGPVAPSASTRLNGLLSSLLMGFLPFAMLF